jgi:hypothetical protein
MYTLGLDTIAGSKLLRLKFGPCGVFQPDQAVMHGERRARFIRVSGGDAIIRPWGATQPIAVPYEALSLPATKGHHGSPYLPVKADARRARAVPSRPRRVAYLGLMPGVASFD